MGRTERFEKPVRCMTVVLDVPPTVKMMTGIYKSKSIAHNLTPRLQDMSFEKRSVVFNYVYNQNPYEALKVLKSLEFHLP